MNFICLKFAFFAERKQAFFWPNKVWQPNVDFENIIFSISENSASILLFACYAVQQVRRPAMVRPNVKPTWLSVLPRQTISESDIPTTDCLHSSSPSKPLRASRRLQNAAVFLITEFASNSFCTDILFDLGLIGSARQVPPALIVSIVRTAF